jgi:DNA polymerase III delta prime subunit
MIPAVISPDTASPGEREVFRRLRDDPGTAGWIVLHSFELPQHKTQIRGEADFVILVPGSGILCLEVKAHLSVRYTPDGEWILGSDPRKRSPFKQAEDNMYSVMEMLGRRRREDANSTVIWFAVLFTHTEFSQPAVEWNEWECLDLSDFHRRPISALVEGVLAKARERMPRKAAAGQPSAEQCRAIAGALRPAFEVVRSPAGRRRAHEEELRAFTEAQYAALDNMRPERNPRVIFEGPAGTGKTLLAIEAARRAVAEGQRPLLLCFNTLLGRWLQDQKALIGEPAQISTLHALMLRLAGIDVPQPTRSEFWSNELPDAAIGHLLESETPPTFDLLIADEAQDMLRDEYLDFLDLLVSGGLSAGRWMLFGDFERQALFDSADVSLDTFRAGRGSAPVYSLRDNCRNTPRIASYASLLGGLQPAYDNVLRADEGPAPRMRYYAAAEEQAGIVEQVLAGLYKEGYAGEDIVLLSPTRERAAALALVNEPWRSRVKAYGDGPPKGYVRWTTVQAFKGMEAPVVILTDIDEVQGSRSEALFYTGLTRATDRLLVLADETVANDVVALVEAAEV